MNNEYIDRHRLHELLVELRDTKKVSDELGKMFLLLVENIMRANSYCRYVGHWKEEMSYNAVIHLIKYAHNYNPEKGHRRRDELNLTRKKPLPPVDDGKIAFNYISWIVFQTLSASIKSLKKKELKYQEYDETICDTIYDPDVDVIEFYDNNFNIIDPLEKRNYDEAKTNIDEYNRTILEIAIKKIKSDNKSYEKVKKWVENQGIFEDLSIYCIKEVPIVQAEEI